MPTKINQSNQQSCKLTCSDFEAKKNFLTYLTATTGRRHVAIVRKIVTQDIPCAYVVVVAPVIKLICITIKKNRTNILIQHLYYLLIIVLFYGDVPLIFC